MSAITPQTEIRLLKCPIESDNLHQITFANATAQYTYFNGLPHLTLDNATYQRDESVIRYPEHIDNIMTYNYVMYQNENYTNKWFYAFITKMEYINDHMTKIYIKQDVFQTWQFDLVYKKCFVEREHVNDDTVGLHTIPENLETGDYVIHSIEYDNYNVNDPYDRTKVRYIVASNLDLEESHPTPGQGTFSYKIGSAYNGIYSGLAYWSADIYTYVMSKLQQVEGCGQIESINSLFMAPKWIVGDYGEGEHSGNVPTATSSASQNINISKNTTLGCTKTGFYTPINNKLLTSEYTYLLVNNGSGGTAKYNWEEFKNSSNQAQFTMYGCLTPGCSIKLVPKNYQEDALSDVNSLILGKYPTLNFSGDMYLNWLTQNAVNSAWDIGLGAVKGVIGTGGSPFALSGVLGSIHSYMQQQRLHQYDPPMNRGNVASGDVSYASGFTRYQFYRMSIKPEYAKIIDSYMSAYGYKVNEFKVPNITGRTNWNYVKTVGAIIEGNVPQEYIEEIKQIFNNGVTLWHNPTTYLDYSQSNAIVT